MDKNLFFYNMLNQYSNEKNEEGVNHEINYDLLNNIKYQQSSQNFISAIFGQNNSSAIFSLNNIKINSKAESDIDKEKASELNKSNNINNNINADKKSIADENNNKNFSYGDYFLNACSIYENNCLIQNKLNLTPINSHNELNNYIINNNKNHINNYDNFIQNVEYNNLDYEKINNNKNISINNIIINNIDFNNNNIFNQHKELLNEKYNIINNKINKSNINNINKDEKNKNGKINYDLHNHLNNIKVKRKRKRKKKIENKINEIIRYGHPNSLIYKTMKQKLNVHKKFDLECRNDSLLFIHIISKLKNIIKKIVREQKIKNTSDFQVLKDLYTKSIISLQHRYYAQEITGYKLE